jgi:hypothetical protein
MMMIGRHSFQIADARFRAYISVSDRGWGASWDLEVNATSREIDGRSWKPQLSSHNSLEGLPVPDALVGTSLGPLKDKGGEPPFMLYMFEHEPVRKVRLSFPECQANRFRIDLRGLTRSWDESEPTQIVQVAASCWAPLEAVVDEHLEAAARKHLEETLPKQKWGHPFVDHYKQVFPWAG